MFVSLHHHTIIFKSSQYSLLIDVSRSRRKKQSKFYFFLCLYYVEADSRTDKLLTSYFSFTSILIALWPETISIELYLSLLRKNSQGLKNYVFHFHYSKKFSCWFTAVIKPLVFLQNLHLWLITFMALGEGYNCTVHFKQ